MLQRDSRFDSLRRAADAAVVDAMEQVISSGTDSHLSRIDALRFAREHSLDEEATIDAFVHAAKLGLFDMQWNLLCPGCGAVMDGGSNLRQMRDEYRCMLCAVAHEPTLDEMVEVSFTINPAVRRIASVSFVR